MLPGNDNRITAAHHSGTPRQEIKKRFPVFLHPKPSRILHRNKIIQLLSENIAKISVFPVVSNIGKNNCRKVWRFLKPSVYHYKTELISSKKGFLFSVFVKCCYENRKRNSGELCQIFLALRSKDIGKKYRRSVGRISAHPSRKSAETHTEEAATF